MLDGPLASLATLKRAKTGRSSSWDLSGRNADYWRIKPRSTVVLADIEGPGAITHIWMTQLSHLREALLKITWDNARYPSVLCPLGDFFGLGHGMVNSYESLLFSASTSVKESNKFGARAALNCYAPMPFHKRAKIELINESAEEHQQYFYIDYERYPASLAPDTGLFHAEFRRENPFGGWGSEVKDHRLHNVVNTERTAWNNNYVILETKGRGHYIGCNVSVSDFAHSWWGEGDDMIWVDGYKWPPDLHGTGSEDYFGQAWGMQPNAFGRNGSTLHQDITGGYQTSYVHHLENPVRFEKEIKVTMENGHGNHLANEWSSVAYWYAEKPARAVAVPPLEKRLPVLKDEQNRWIFDKRRQKTSGGLKLTPEMRAAKAKWRKR